MYPRIIWLNSWILRFFFSSRDDFDLGGDFGKLSSFRIDMSDLDFPVSLKKTTKVNENEILLGKQDLKKDNFTFMIDFNKYVFKFL